MVRASALCVSAVAMAGQAAADPAAVTGCAADLAIFATPSDAPKAVADAAPANPITFHVEIADDPQERARGLMYRRELPQGQGMLFIYDTPQQTSFWMRNTLIPLDLVFMDAAGRIRHIHPMAKPLDETPIPGALAGDPAPLRLMILEIAGGEAARLGLMPGQAMAHPRLDPAWAALTCK